MEARPQVVIVDDQPVFREAARQLLAARGYDVVAEAGCAAGAVDAVERHEPHAVLLDVRLGEDDGLAVCSELTDARPDLAVLLASDAEYWDSRGAGGPLRRARVRAQVAPAPHGPRAVLAARLTALTPRPGT